MTDLEEGIPLMPVQITPDACPDCGTGFDIPYSTHRNARMPVAARLFLFAGIVATMLLLLTSMLYLGELIAELTRDSRLNRKERGMLFALSYFIATPLIFLPVFVAWRIAFRQPRRLPIQCPVCTWQGICMVSGGETELPSSRTVPPQDSDGSFAGIPAPTSPTEKRLERLQQRRRRKNKERESQQPPNPDFDFQNDAPSPPGP